MKYPFVFIDESGISDGQDNRQPFFGIGFLKIYNPTFIMNSLLEETFSNISIQRDKRKKIFKELQSNPKVLSAQELNNILLSSTHNEYHFTNLSFTNIERYKRFIDIAVNFQFHFCALLIDKKSQNFSKDVHGSYWEAYLRHTKMLCEKNLKSDEMGIMIADYLNKPSDSSKTIDCITQNQKIANVIRTESFGNPLIQLCDVFLGSVIFQHKHNLEYTNKDSNRVAAKLDFTNYLSRKLSGEDNKLYGNKTISKDNKYFSIWNFKLNKK